MHDRSSTIGDLGGSNWAACDSGIDNLANNTSHSRLRGDRAAHARLGMCTSGHSHSR